MPARARASLECARVWRAIKVPTVVENGGDGGQTPERTPPPLHLVSYARADVYELEVAGRSAFFCARHGSKSVDSRRGAARARVTRNALCELRIASACACALSRSLSSTCNPALFDDQESSRIDDNRRRGCFENLDERTLWHLAAICHWDKQRARAFFSHFLFVFANVCSERDNDDRPRLCR